MRTGKLKNSNDLDGIRVEVKSSRSHEEGTIFTCVLLEDGPGTAWKVGTEIDVARYELEFDR